MSVLKMERKSRVPTLSVLPIADTQRQIGLKTGDYNLTTCF